MSRKDYRAFANAFLAQRNLCRSEADQQLVDAIVSRIGDVLARDNARFNFQTWYRECGVGQPFNPDNRG